MNRTIEKIFGANWSTTLWGIVTGLALLFAGSPELLNDLLPAAWTLKVVAVSKIIVALSVSALGLAAKGRNVTGGIIGNSKRDADAEDIEISLNKN